MPATRNLCAQLPLDLHQRVCEAREQSGLTTAQYITELLTEYFKMKENGGKDFFILTKEEMETVRAASRSPHQPKRGGDAR